MVATIETYPVTVLFNAEEQTLLTGAATVATIRQDLKALMNIPSRAYPRLNGMVVEETAVVGTGATVEFVVKSGAKGGRKPKINRYPSPDEITEEDKRFFQGWPPATGIGAKDDDESARVARRIGAAMTQCWFNARKAIMRLDEYADASYIEGWAFIGALATEHGWVVANGKIIDPTVPGRTVVYFPGLEFAGRQGIEEFLQTARGGYCKNSPFFHAFGWGGMYSPSFRKCYEDALAYVRQLEQGKK